MAENNTTRVPLTSADATERALWEALGEIEPAEPSAELRQSFYRRLAAASRSARLEHWLGALGLRGRAGWLTAAACLLAGLGIGHATGGGDGAADSRLAALEADVTMLNRRLILDRLEDDTPSKRLRGVVDAARMAADDAEIAQALLVRATEDRVPSVRSAAIDALGARVAAPAVGSQVMTLLGQADSPLVQLALIDLVLRYGNDAQIDQLVTLAEQDRLYPDLKRHVLAVLKRDMV